MKYTFDFSYSLIAASFEVSSCIFYLRKLYNNVLNSQNQIDLGQTMNKFYYNHTSNDA